MPLHLAGAYQTGMARLSQDKWIDAGFDAIAATGPTALAAEPLARRLKTTKGSFYWHFKDVPAYQEAVLTRWKARALEQVLHQVRMTNDPDKGLRTFGALILSDKVEPQLRIWARNDKRVAKALAEVDAEREAHLTRLLGQLGLRNADFARALQAALVGLSLQPRPDKAAYETLIDTVLALQ